jgi:hypothetical protein
MRVRGYFTAPPEKLGETILGILLFLWLPNATPQEKHSPSREKYSATYKLVEGAGYTVCESYVRMLNSVAKSAPPPICEQQLDPRFPEFAFPEWVVLNANDHLDVIEQIERWLFSRSKWLSDWGLYSTADEWVAEVKRRIKSGESIPRLRKTELVLRHGDKRETLLAYTRDLGQCKRDLEQYGATHASWDFVFLYDAEGRLDFNRLSGLGGGEHGWMQVLLHKGTPYLHTTHADAPKAEPITFRLRVARRPVTELHKDSYVLLTRCGVRMRAPLD